MIVGKYDWFCDMKCLQTQKEARVHSEVWSVIYVYRRLTLFIVHTINPSYFAILTNWDYFHLRLFSYLHIRISNLYSFFHKYKTIYEKAMLLLLHFK